MLKLASALVIPLIALAPAAAAEPLTLSGTVGPAPVLLMLDNDRGKLAGWYLYLRVGKQIRLAGQLAEGGAFTLDEFAPPDDRKTGRFTGALAQGRWTGTWQKTEGGAPLAIVLAEGGQPLADLTGTFRCTASKNDRQFGFRYRYDLDLRVTKGKVGKLALRQRVTAKDGDEQGCAIGLDDLTQEPSAGGLVLKTEGEGDRPRCTVRVTGAGGHLYVKIGEAGGNDCRGGEGTMYCSPRSFWADMIVDRKTSACKPVE